MSDTKTIEVELTEDDMRHGKANDCAECPVARAVARALPGAEPHVFHEEIELYGKYDGSATTPEEVSKWIDDFDSARNVAPFRFTLKFESFGLRTLP